MPYLNSIFVLPSAGTALAGDCLLTPPKQRAIDGPKYATIPDRWTTALFFNDLTVKQDSQRAGGQWLQV
jgi:hypothetical protein